MTSLFRRLYDKYNQGYYNEVVSIAELEIQNCLASSDSSKIQAASYFKLGDFQKCYDILAQLESLYSSEPDYLSLYAASCRRLGYLDKSSQLFKLALSIQPDSILIKNNYANLLIDLSQFDQALSLLDEILSVSPGYEDAIQNKNRLEFLVSEKPKASHTIRSDKESSLVDLGDPLLLAFADDEIEQSSKRYKFKREISKNDLGLPVPDSSKTVQDFIKMAYRASSTGDFNFALKLCSQSLQQIGPHSLIYDCASDMYLNLKNFRQAELCILHAISLDGPSPKRMLNLSNFASMRGDIQLAKKYLETAASLDPSHPHLKPISQSLDKKNAVSSFDFASEWCYPEMKS